MKMQSTTLKQALCVASQAEEKIPLLNREEILAILREADDKKALSPLIIRRSILPRIWKIAAATLSAAAIIILFLRFSDTTPSNNPKIAQSTQEREIISENESPKSDIYRLDNTNEDKTKLKQDNSMQIQEIAMTKKEPNAEKKTISKETVIMSGSSSVKKQVAMAMKEESVYTNAESVSKDYSLKDEIIVSPERIEPILGRRINEAEIALGIMFDSPQKNTRKLEESAPILSLGRSLSQQNNSLMPKSERLPSSNTPLDKDLKLSRSNNNTESIVKSKKTLMEILLGATSNPQMVTLVRNGEIVANKWNYAIADATPDQLQPVYISLKGKEAAEGIADYALLWLPPASAQGSTLENRISVNVSPNPIEKERAQLEVFVQDEIVVSIAIYDMFGKKIQDLAQMKQLSKGANSLNIKVDFPDGVYTVVIIGTNNVSLATKRFIVEKTR